MYAGFTFDNVLHLYLMGSEIQGWVCVIQPCLFEWFALKSKNVSPTVRDQKFAGIPVLFLPGNGGSYRQVRSLGSVSLRKSEDVQLKIWFDYFSVDFNEELSGLVGTLLQEQTQFVARVVDHILTLYKGGWSVATGGYEFFKSFVISIHYQNEILLVCYRHNDNKRWWEKIDGTPSTAQTAGPICSYEVLFWSSFE